MKNLVKTILQSLIGLAVLLGIMYLLGLVTNFIENHFWLIIPLGIITIIQIFKEI